MFNIILIYTAETIVNLIDLLNKLLNPKLLLIVVLMSLFYIIVMFIFFIVSDDFLEQSKTLQLIKNSYNIAKKVLKFSFYTMIYSVLFSDNTYVKQAINASYAIVIYKTESVQIVKNKIVDLVMEQIKNIELKMNSKQEDKEEAKDKHTERPQEENKEVTQQEETKGSTEQPQEKLETN